jgi:hypothetical protein
MIEISKMIYIFLQLHANNKCVFNFFYYQMEKCYGHMQFFISSFNLKWCVKIVRKNVRNKFVIQF